MDERTVDEEVCYETERRLDLLNGLKAKYGQSIGEILAYQDRQQKKLEKMEKFEEIFRQTQAELAQAQKILEKYSNELSEIRKEYSKQLEVKIMEGLKDLNFLDVDFSIAFS